MARSDVWDWGLGMHTARSTVSRDGAVHISRAGAGGCDVDIRFRQAELYDAHRIVPRLRQRDYENLERFGAPVMQVEDALRISVAAFTAELDGNVVAMWGVRATCVLDDRAYLWMLGTPAIEEHPFAFLRYSRVVMRHMRDHYSMLYGEIEVDYVASIRWLRWLGARILPGPERLMFAFDGRC